MSGKQQNTQEVTDDFFDDFYEEESKAKSGESTPGKAQANAESQTPDTDYKTMYSESSREGKRLKEELDQLKPFEGLINAIANDENLSGMVKGYLETGQAPPVSIKEKLGLDEDFIYDSDEAISDPDSDSAKVFQASVASVAQQQTERGIQQLREENQRQQIAAERNQEKMAFMQKHNMSEEEFEAWARAQSNNQITLDDIYNLNRLRQGQPVSPMTMQQQQQSNFANMPGSYGNMNTPAQKPMTEEEMFKSLVGMDNSKDGLNF